MKKLALVLVVVLVCAAVMVTQTEAAPAKRPGDPGYRRRPKGVKCGAVTCAPYQRCEKQLIPEPTLLDHQSSASTVNTMMKKVALVLVVVLLCTEVMLTEAQVRPPGRSSNPAGRQKPKPVKCGKKFCEPHQRCERQLVPEPTCY
ncbi:hypothetical protein MTO96_001806 [Rhipicephalus appendiculatus]